MFKVRSVSATPQRADAVLKLLMSRHASSKNRSHRQIDILTKSPYLRGGYGTQGGPISPVYAMYLNICTSIYRSICSSRRLLPFMEYSILASVPA